MDVEKLNEALSLLTIGHPAMSETQAKQNAIKIIERFISLEPQSPATVDGDESLLQECAKIFKMIKDLSGNQKIKHESFLMLEKIGERLVFGRKKTTPQPSPASEPCTCGSVGREHCWCKDKPASEKQVAALAALASYRWHHANGTVNSEIFDDLERIIRTALSQPAQPVVSEVDPDCKCFPSYLCNHCENMAALENNND